MRILKAVGVIFGLLILAGVVGSLTGKPAATPIINRPSAAGSAAAVGTSAPTSTAAQQAKIGDTVRFGNWSYTVTRVDKAKTLKWSDFGSSVTALGQFVVVSITLRNVGDRNFPINTFDFQLTDSTAAKYDTSSKFELYSYVTYVKLTNLGEQFPPGVDVASALIFDVNPSATGLKLVLKQANNATIALD